MHPPRHAPCLVSEDEQAVYSAFIKNPDFKKLQGYLNKNVIDGDVGRKLADTIAGIVHMAETATERRHLSSVAMAEATFSWCVTHMPSEHNSIKSTLLNVNRDFVEQVKKPVNRLRGESVERL